MTQTTTYILIGTLTVLIGTLAYVNIRMAQVGNGEFPHDPVMCTMDAKICPDGSSVGRVPPSCEFAPCPDGDVYIDTPARKPCPEDAKICPDGTSVVRVGPNCEFAPCPVERFEEPEDPVDVTGPVSYPTLVNYGQDPSRMEEYRADCEERGGYFAECGSSCKPGAKVCDDVCQILCISKIAQPKN